MKNKDGIWLTVCIGLLILLNSCNPAKRATRFMNEHPAVLAPVCADKFPVIPIDTTITYSTDSGAYEEAITSLVFLVDSLLNSRDTVLINGTEVIVIKTNVDSLRAALKREIKRSVKPCIDSLEIRTVTKIDNASLSDCTFKLIAERENRIKVESERNVYKKQAKSRLWWMIIFAAGFLTSTFLGIRKRLSL